MTGGARKLDARARVMQARARASSFRATPNSRFISVISLFPPPALLLSRRI
jgi:hypothetical protein